MMINNSTRIGLTSQLGSVNKNLAKILEKLSTGRRINSAADDAAGLAVAEQLMTQVRGFKQASNNTEYATAALQIGEGAANEVSDMLQRQRELAVQASNDTLTNQQRTGLNKEYQALSQEITRISNTSQFNTQGTANGTGVATGTAKVMVGANPGDEVTLPSANYTANAIGVGGTDIATAANARNALSSIDTAISNVNATRSTAGATMNRLEHTYNNLQNQYTNTQAAESVIRDMDYAQGTAEFVRQGILSQSSTMALKNFNQIYSQNLMALLK